MQVRKEDMLQKLSNYERYMHIYMVVAYNMLKKQYDGYLKSCTTPYIHILAFHVPEFIRDSKNSPAKVRKLVGSYKKTVAL